jgi:phosphatidylinositol glycan class K
MTGHGGDGFLKFQDYEELSSQDIADAIQEMYVKKRYNEIFFMVDTCQAGSLAKPLTSPHVVTIGSSLTGESSYAHHSDRKIGVAVIDRFTYATLDYLQKLKVGEDTIRDGTLQDLFQFFDPRMLYSTPDYRTELLGRSIDKVQITDFLGSILAIHLHKEEEAYPLYGFDQEEEEEEEEEAIKQETENDIEEFSFKSNHRSLNVSSNINLESEKKNPRVHIHEKFAFSQEFLIGCVIFVLSFITITSSHI